jgi:hypothetical protein
MNILNNKKFFENEWYDCIAESSEDFVEFLNNTNLKYPKVMLLSSIDVADIGTLSSVRSADIYCPKGTTYTATIYLSKYSSNLFNFHNMKVTVVTDEYISNRELFYFRSLSFDNCTVTINMLNNADVIPDTPLKTFSIWGLKNSTVDFYPAAPAECSWNISLDGTASIHSVNSTVNVKNVTGQSTKKVDFNNSGSCTVTAYNITEDFKLSYSSTSLNTFIDKDGTLKRIDVSTLKVVYNDVEEFDAIAFDKTTLSNVVSSAPAGLRRRILYIGNGEPLTLDTADFPTQLSYNGGDTDVYFAKSHNVVISDSTTSTTTLGAFLNNVTWHGAIINAALSQAYTHMGSLITNLNLADSDLYITDDASVSEVSVYFKDMSNSRCFITGSANLTLSLENCNKVETYIRNLSGVIRTVFIKRTYDSVIDVNTGVTLTTGTLLQYGAGSNMFQYGASNKQLVNFTLQALN